jgi:hypothetical protein
MTTFAELKVSLAADLSDTDGKVFVDSDLGIFINKAIAEVSRVAPQEFTEDVAFSSGQLSYPLRGGQGNLVANSSFEEGDDTVLGATTATTVAVADAEDLLNGWLLSASAGVYFPTSPVRVTGRHVGILRPAIGGIDVKMYQDIPVNAGTVYILSGYHWKLTTGGLTNRIRVDALDASSVLVASGVISHDTTSSVPVQVSDSYTVPADDTVAFLRVNLLAIGTQPSTQQAFAYEDISLLEQTDAILVSSTARTQIEVSRVEVWDSTREPERFVSAVPSARSVAVGREPSSSSGGYRFWDGSLVIPNWLEDRLIDGTHFLRVWGYAPYDRLREDEQVADLSDELEFAVIFRAFIEGIRRLTQSRALFTQWQTRNNNTDVSVASLMSDLSTHLQEWRQMKRELVVLRERG